MNATSEIDKLKEILRIEKSHFANIPRFFQVSLDFDNYSDIIGMSDRIDVFDSLLESHKADHTIPAEDLELNLIELTTSKPENTIGSLHYKPKSVNLVSRLDSKRVCQLSTSDVGCTIETKIK